MTNQYTITKLKEDKFTVENFDGHLCYCATKDRAEFIVRACNSHDELLKACKELYSTIKDTHDETCTVYATESGCTCRNMAIKFCLQQAIAKAEGK